jgi:hypothetical protein
MALMMEIQHENQDEEYRALNCAKGGLEIGLSRIVPQFPEKIFIPQENKCCHLSM